MLPVIILLVPQVGPGQAVSGQPDSQRSATGTVHWTSPQGWTGAKTGIAIAWESVVFIFFFIVLVVAITIIVSVAYPTV